MSNKTELEKKCIEFYDVFVKISDHTLTEVEIED